MSLLSTMQFYKQVLYRMFRMVGTSLGWYTPVEINYHPIDTPIIQPQVYEYIDPEYIGECCVDLESEFTYELITDINNGLRAVNIYHGDALDNRAQQIETLIRHNETRTRLFQAIDGVIEKIRLEYPMFTYHIHHDMRIYSEGANRFNDGGRQHGTQIRRILTSEMAMPGLEGMQGVAGERYNMGNAAW